MRPFAALAASALSAASAASALAACALLAACATAPIDAWRSDPAWPRADVLLLGEQHDAREHQRIERDVVVHLAEQGRLVAFAIEMAERGRSTDALPRDADESSVRTALAWDERGWPWPAYGPAVMAAVRHGVPVVGANLPRVAMREAMRDERLDTKLDAATLATLRTDVRDGHCNLLPASQLPGMARIQLARDAAMAETLRERAAPGKVVLLVAGANHADATRGVPRYLPAQLTRRSVRLAAGAVPGASSPGFDETWPTTAVPAVDHCAGLAEKFAPER